MRTITCDRCGKAEAEVDPDTNLASACDPQDIRRTQFGVVPISVQRSTMGLTFLCQDISKNGIRIDLCSKCHDWLVDEMTGKHRVETR